MIVLDVDVLVAAFRQDHPRHPAARGWLERRLSDSEAAVIVPDLVWVGFLRIVTNRRIFDPPAPFAEARRFAETVTSANGYRPWPGLTDGLAHVLQLATRTGASGNLLPDAYIAALALSLAAPVATFDTDFHRFAPLEVVAPA